MTLTGQTSCALHPSHTVPAVDDAGVWQLVPGDRMVPVSIPLAHVMATETSKFVAMNKSPVQTKHGLRTDVYSKIHHPHLN
jgi:uncharacterized protein YfaA (DUF2138 family)